MLKKIYTTRKTIFISVLTLILLCILLVYNKRETIFETALEQMIKKARIEYDLNIRIEEAKLLGWYGRIIFKNLSIVPEHRDSLVNIKSLQMEVKFMPLLWGDIKLSKVILEDGYVNLVRKDSVANYDFLFRKKGNKQSDGMNLAKVVDKLLNQALYKIPDNMDLRNLKIKFKDETATIDLHTTTATIVKNEVKSTIKVNGQQAVWHIMGQVYPHKKRLDLTLFAEGKKVELPYFHQKFGLKLNFDTVHTQMKMVDYEGADLKVSGSWFVKNLTINHPRIATNDVTLEEGSIDADIRIGEKVISLDSSSVIHFKNIKVNPFIRYTLYPQKIYELDLRTGSVDAQQLFDAFPTGMFESLQGMQVGGKLQYQLHFYLDSKEPDKVEFESSLNKIDFKIKKWGSVNLQKINHSFTYTPYEYGKPMRSILIGPESANFVSLDHISPYLKSALLTAEDPSFFRHKGFVEESIRKSIVVNFQKKAFKRGGSTISMQLVKNVYLSRQKTLARKIEEMLIVWLIEQGRLSSKERMLEIYLNLIEWGVNIYGIGEAAHFYFGKHPADLDLGESVFLASIVPRPKLGLRCFEPSGHLRTHLRGYFKLIGGLMAQRKMILPDTSSYGFYTVRLKEGLRSHVAKIDSTLLEKDLEERDENF